MYKIFFAFGIMVLLSVSKAYASQQVLSKESIELAKLTFSEQTYYQNARRFALLGMKEEYENDPRTKPYSEIIISTLIEVIDAYLKDPQTIQNVIHISATLYDAEFTANEMKELSEFYNTDLGKKVVNKMPMITQKQWEMESQLKMPEKYKAMIIEKLGLLQKSGKIPREFK